MSILRKIAKNINTSPQFSGIVNLNVPMDAHTTFKVGGKADAFVVPADEKSFLFVLNCLVAENVPFFILGGGSNLVVSDDGIEGFVIATSAFTTIELVHKDESTQDDLLLFCGAGCTFEQITDFCIENGLSGLENFAGLPGTVGGAVYMNARCYEKSISDVLTTVSYISSEGFDSVRQYSIDESEWDYKKSPFQAQSRVSDNAEAKQSECAGAVILSAVFCVKKGDCVAITEECACYIENRKKKGHFRYPSAGSAFKNNRAFGKSSGQIIDEVGLCGFQVGNAQIAPWHGNFVVNLGCASADDIRELVTRVQIQVKAKTGFDLECEILFCGNIAK